jgi:xanthine dehydrogenase YagR molybdenum-binding subunit
MPLSKDGRATVEIAAHETGMGTSTTKTMVTEDRLGLGMELRHGELPRFAFPRHGPAWRLSQTASIGAAVTVVHYALITELFTLLGKDSPLSGLDADEVVGIDGQLAKLSGDCF